jgi:Mlc titration factor MtfA (ptsG expression regulator)
MHTIYLYLILLLILLLPLLLLVKKKVKVVPMSSLYKSLLLEHVPFYQQLPENNKPEFENRVQLFLAQVKITGTGTVIEDLDRVLIAASAIIPIFNFPKWEYINLHEILLYPNSFNHDFDQHGPYRDILGMVGNGPMNRIMILSQSEIRQAFSNETDKRNTAIHEFVHLIDVTDGAMDGVPSVILEKQYIVPWLQLMQKEIGLILDNQSDINPYGATNQSEFFAVVSEYFFERPEMLQHKHPELFELLQKIFSQR